MGLFDRFKKKNNETDKKEQVNMQNGKAVNSKETSSKAEAVVNCNKEENKKNIVPLTEARKNEIGPIVFSENIDGKMLDNINVQENIFLLKSIEHFNNLSALQNFEKNHQIIYDGMINKVKNSEILYILFDQVTGYPFLSEGTVEVYSQYRFAEEAVKHYFEMYRKLEIRTVEKEKTGLPENIDLFAFLYYLGIDKIVIDNGMYSVKIDRAEILPPPDWSNAEPITIPVTNPSLRYAMLDFLGEARWAVSYPDREKNAADKERTMLNEIKAAKYLIPMQTTGKTEKTEEYKITFKQGGTMRFAMITNSDDKVFVPLFTDWIEFRKVYNQDEWSGCIFSLSDAIAIGEKDEGIVINAYGENVILNNEIIAKLKDEI